jgi:coatomer subunit beta
MSILPSIKPGKVFRGILWVFGESVEDKKGITAVVQEVRKAIGDLPVGASERRALEETNGGEDEKEKNVEGAAGSIVARPKVEHMRRRLRIQVHRM